MSDKRGILPAVESNSAHDKPTTKMNNQYTPGPWSVADVDGNPDIVLVCADDKHANGEWEIATPHGPDAVANAHLIAAAPELLALCKRLTDSAECCVSLIPAAGFKSADGLDALCKEARATIAKAEGQS